MSFGQNTDQGFGGFGSADTNQTNTYSNDNSFSTSNQASDGFGSWSGPMFNMVGNIAGALITKDQYGNPINSGGIYGYNQPRRDNTIMYVVGAIVLLAVLYIFSKGKK